MSSEKSIEDAEVIAGFFREALFHQRSIAVIVDGQAVAAKITDILENSSRNRSDRKIRISCDSAGQALPDRDGLFRMRCGFPHFIASWTSEISCADGDSRIVAMPAQLLIGNVRSERRTSSKLAPEKGLPAVPVMMSSDGVYVEGLFELENHSSKGVGGILSVLPEFEISTRTKIKGVLRLSHGPLRLNGVIARAQMLEAGIEARGRRFRVGIQQKMPAPPASREKKHRSTRRFDARFELELVSSLHPRHSIDFSVLNASVSGFRGAPMDPSDAEFLTVGLAVKLKDSSLVAELVAQEGLTCHFQLVSGSSQDRLAWLGRLSRQARGIHRKIGSGSDIIDLFCESGAFSSKYLAEQSRFSAQMADALSADATTDGWAHRWIERADHGEIKGHIAALRMGDNLWHLGDIAGMRRLEQKISKRMIPSFFENFMEFCLHLEPCPRVMIAWVEGHAYWQGFQRYLETAGPELAVQFRAQYFRTLAGDCGRVSSIQSKRITSSEFSLINDVLASAPPDLQLLLRSLDFSCETFGSHQLGSAIARSGQQFQRQYVLAEVMDARFLLIIHHFPLASSPQRSLEVPWIVPISPLPPRGEIIAELVSFVREYGLRNGFHFPGVLVASRAESAATGNATKSMLWTIAHPNALRFFAKEASEDTSQATEATQ